MVLSSCVCVCACVGACWQNRTSTTLNLKLQVVESLLPRSSVKFWSSIKAPSWVFLFCFIVYCFLFFWDRVSLCSPGCPGTHSVDQPGLELRNPPASASWVLGFYLFLRRGFSVWLWLYWNLLCRSDWPHKDFPASDQAILELRNLPICLLLPPKC